MFTRSFFLFSLLLCVGVLAGCMRGQPHDKTATHGHEHETLHAHGDPHDVPLTEAEIDALREETATWSAAIDHIRSYRDVIHTETTAGMPAKAHRSLDLLDYVLEWLPEIAQRSNVPREHWQTVGENAQTLRDLFNQVHAEIDAGQAPDYASVADRIDVAVAALAGIPAGDPRTAMQPEGR